MKVKLIVLDMAGTTVYDDAYVSKCLAAAINRFGYAVPFEEIQPIMGYEKPEAIQMLLERYEKDTQKIRPQFIDYIHTDFVKSMIYFYKTSPDIKPLDGVEDVLRKIRKLGIAIGLDTGFSKDIAEVIMNRLQWKEKGLVQHLIASDEVPKGRPHPFMIQKMMAAENISDPKEVIKIGDTEVDINEGKNSNCLFSIGVTTGAFTREALELHHPDYIFDHLAELLPVLEKHNA